MGILLSVLESVFSYFNGASSRKNEYIVVENNEPDKTLSEVKDAEKPKTHMACRSSNQHRLTSYQSKIDNLKPTEIIYVCV